jgi:surface antigen
MRGLLRFARPSRVSFFISAAVFGVVLAIAPTAAADTFDNQINALNQLNSSNRSAVSNLESQEASLAAQVASLQAQIASIQAQINANKAKQADLNARIVQAQAELDKAKKTLGESIRAMYLEEKTPTWEMLMTSKDLSNFFDRAQYRESVRNNVKEGLDRVNALKAQLESEKKTVEKLIVDQQAMQGQISAQEGEVSRLLSLNQDQQNSYQSDINANNSRIANLRRQQAIENAKNFVGRVATGGTGSYPWANAPFPNTIADPWGMYLRQCVSYTAWKVSASGRHMPFWGGRGNANQWDDNARRAGIPVDYTPRAGDVAVSNAGTYGHVMYVEAVHGDGTISISQYNAGWDGRFSTGRRTTAGLLFIHFP